MKLIDSTHLIAKKFLLDRGVRKYSLIVICMLFLVGGLALTGVITATAAQYATFVGGILALYAIYCGGNVASKWSPTSASEDTKPTDEGPGPQN